MRDQNEYVYYYQQQQHEGGNDCAYDKLLYHYSSLRFGESDLLKRHFKLSAPGGFNDPLDTVGCYKRYPTEEAFFKYFADMLFKDEVQEMRDCGCSNKTIWREYRRYVTSAYSGLMLSRNPLAQNLMMSFCGVENNVISDALLWAHYADGGKGMRIGMKFSEDDGYDIRPITYVGRMPSLDFHELTKLDPSGSDFSEKLSEYHRDMIWSKHKAWKYEHEYRLSTNTAERGYVEQNENEMWFVKFQIERVQTVDFGCRAFGDNKYKADELFIRKALSLHRKTGVPLNSFRKAEIRLGSYGYDYVAYDKVVGRFLRRYKIPEIRRKNSLRCPSAIRKSRALKL